MRVYVYDCKNDTTPLHVCAIGRNQLIWTVIVYATRVGNKPHYHQTALEIK